MEIILVCKKRPVFFFIIEIAMCSRKRKTMKRIVSRVSSLLLLTVGALSLTSCGEGTKIAKMGIDEYFNLDDEMPSLTITSAYVTSYNDEEYKDYYIVSYDIKTEGFAGYMDFYYDDSTSEFTIEGIMATTEAEFADASYQSSYTTLHEEYEEIVYAEQHPDEYPDYNFEKLNAQELNTYIRRVS
jgi:hypothetical protein